MRMLSVAFVREIYFSLLKIHSHVMCTSITIILQQSYASGDKETERESNTENK